MLRQPDVRRAAHLRQAHGAREARRQVHAHRPRAQPLHQAAAVAAQARAQRRRASRCSRSRSPGRPRLHDGQQHLATWRRPEAGLRRTVDNFLHPPRRRRPKKEVKKAPLAGLSNFTSAGDAQVRAVGPRHRHPPVLPELGITGGELHGDRAARLQAQAASRPTAWRCACRARSAPTTASRAWAGATRRCCEPAPRHHRRAPPPAGLPRGQEDRDGRLAHAARRLLRAQHADRDLRAARCSPSRGR